MRASAAAYRRTERETQRKNREAARLYRQQQKQEEILNTAEAVQQYSNYVTVLKSTHKDVAEPVSWETILASDPPPHCSHQ